ncbi:class F sortase [Pseudonocardia broussonetiae]|uniref:class F sortase n=1 Tax=Pseudonocardia broussonetiae TaxID=2736640 RepID=UPI001F04895A|nr:class F sortase [Pseudonocardia broussonetiae]
MAGLLTTGCAAGAPAPAAAPAPVAAAAAPAPAPAAVLAEPAAVAIPAIGVRSDLLSLGLTAEGAAEVPQDFDRAGWFRGGGRPGGRGPTVLLGHVDSADGPAVFHRLRDLRPGDVVEVTAADGTPARYAVERTEQVDKDAFPTFAVFGATPDDVLRLVTCAGGFDRGARSYTDNLVVHATRI